MTVCFQGKKAISKKDSDKRSIDFIEIISKITKFDCKPQAIIFPGGFFFLNHHIGNLDFANRKRVIEASPIGAVCQNSVDILKSSLREPLLVVGIDTRRKARPGCSPDNGDQLCVAVDKKGVVGIGRKIFPDDYERSDYVTYADDFRGRGRIIRLPDGRKAVLCACYDMFGIAESGAHVTKRTKNIEYIGDGKAPVIEPSGQMQAEIRDSLVRTWADMLKREEVSVGFAAIHQFDRPGRDLYWQRHGIAVASAALGGGLAIGAAHFVEHLPVADKSTLAAFGVPHSHLAAGLHRKHYAVQPIDSLYVKTTHGRALLRTFIA